MLYAGEGGRVARVGGLDFRSGHALAVGGKSGVEVARFNDRHADAGPAQLHAQSLAVALDGEFARRVETLERQSDETAYAAQADNLTAAPLAHRRHYVMQETHHSHPVHVHLQAGIGERGEF